MGREEAKPISSFSYVLPPLPFAARDHKANRDLLCVVPAREGPEDAALARGG